MNDETREEDQLVCRGCYALGTACGACSRCREWLRTHPEDAGKEFKPRLDETSDQGGKRHKLIGGLMVGIPMPDQPAIRIGSRWRNKTHGFIFEMISKAQLCVLVERHSPGGFSWVGNESELLQQWEQIEP